MISPWLTHCVIYGVKDEGIGIQKEDEEKIFERFYRADKSHSNQAEGTGLGLAIVKNAVLYHGGEITLKTKENKGTEIIITLPIEKA